MIRSNILRGAHSVYVEWLFGGGSDAGFGYSRDWIQHSPRLLFWYAVAGVPRGGEELAWRWLALLDKGGDSRLPKPRRRSWRDARALSSEIQRWTGSALIPWLASLGQHSVLGWLRLQEVYLIGPKVASWIMRDVSFMADYTSQVRSTTLVYRNRRDRRWFTRLSPKAQACYVWVYEYALETGALAPAWKRRGLAKIQGSPELHLEAATEIVTFARKRGHDPRDLDCFWYQLGSGTIDKVGRVNGRGHR